MRRYHRDGDLRNRRTREVEISVEPNALQVLVPPGSIRASH
jgi:diacylglycerol kinase family enzyme